MLRFNLNALSQSDILYERKVYKDGQPHIKLRLPDQKDDIQVITRITNPSELFEVCMVADILSDWTDNIELFITYLMGARMDRSIDDEQPLTLRVVSDIIKTCYFDKIKILDPHSDVSVELLGAEAISNENFIYNVLEDIGGDGLAHTQWQDQGLVLVAPDKGARAKVEALAFKFNLPFTNATKERDSETGELSHFELQDGFDLAGHRCLIVDDICDGGRTFVGVAELLRKAGADIVDLAVTHGIFSHGVEALDGIDKVYTTDSYPDEVSRILLEMDGVKVFDAVPRRVEGI